MNSLVRRLQNQNDLSKIGEVLNVCYQAGQAHEQYNMVDHTSEYVTGRLRDLVQLLELEFDNEGNIDWNRIITKKELYARA